MEHVSYIFVLKSKAQYTHSYKSEQRNMHTGCFTAGLPHILGIIQEVISCKNVNTTTVLFPSTACCGHFKMCKQQMLTCLYFIRRQHWWQCWLKIWPPTYIYSDKTFMMVSVYVATNDCQLLLSGCGAPPHFGQVTAGFNQHYKNQIGHCCPIVWLLWPLDMTSHYIFLWGLKTKEMTYRNKVHMIEVLPH
jgi:hypothetical protein